MDIRPCTVAEILGSGLIEEYAAESQLPDAPPAIPDPALYRAMESNGMIHPVGAFIGSRMIGFVVVLTNIMPHYGQRFAVTESLFVGKSSRGTGAGMKLISMAETIAGIERCAGLLVSAPVNGCLDKLMSRMDEYTATNRAYWRPCR